MLAYWLLFLTAAAATVGWTRPYPSHYLPHFLSVTLYVICAVLVLVIGLRHEVGGDWIAYAQSLDALRGLELSEALFLTDPAYALLSWLGSNYFGGIYFVNFFCALFFVFGLYTFSRAQPRPFLALSVAIPFLVVVVAMGYTRQGTAIGIAMLSLLALQKGNVWRFLAWIALAALFHKSALILTPLAFLSPKEVRIKAILASIVLFTILFVLLYNQPQAVDILKRGYIDAEYDSSGAAIRIAMNALPAAFFLWKRREFRLPNTLVSPWTWLSIIALLFVPLLILSPSSTAVDRVGLYWIPLQIFVFSRMPDVLGRHGRHNSVWVLIILGYYASIQFVWLNFGSHAAYWIPYRFYPFEVLWR